MSRKDETQPDNKLCEDGSESFPFRPSRKRKIASTSAYWTLPENSKSVSMPSERESPPGEETKSKKDVVDLLKNLEKRFEGKLSSLKQNDISFEYNLVKGRGEKHSCGLQTSVGSAPKNADKNRYTDVIPFDMNCVELSGGQYVNASCVRVRPSWKSSMSATPFLGLNPTYFNLYWFYRRHSAENWTLPLERLVRETITFLSQLLTTASLLKTNLSLLNGFASTSIFVLEQIRFRTLYLR
mmetsp:Transcript_32873/g.77968  ORF Transcript_32873/g.77968 Transcript_32873/m.77968 type:complete len:240 (-) Transcript_32873:1184-1903(-)